MPQVSAVLYGIDMEEQSDKESPEETSADNTASPIDIFADMGSSTEQKQSAQTTDITIEKEPKNGFIKSVKNYFEKVLKENVDDDDDDL